MFASNSGGALYVDGELFLVESTVEGNEAQTGGGAYVSTSGSLTVEQSLFVGNSATNGGAVYSDGAFSAENSTFSGNSATTNGGAIYQANNDNASISHSTIANNTASTGGGLYLNQFFTSFTTLFGSIIADNAGGDCFTAGSVIANYNLISDLFDDDVCFLTDGFNNNQLGEDPLLGSLMNNGDATKTHLPATTSPAIDQINPADESSCGTTYDTDQRGLGRPVNTSCDVGAVERQVLECEASYEVGTLTELNEAISCYNAATAGTLPITLTNNLTLNAATTTINNSTSAILTVEGNDFTIDGDDTYRIFTVTDGNVTIQNMILQNGLGSQSCGAFTCGGGVYVGADAAVTLNQVTVQDGVAQLGAGIYSLGALTVAESTVQQNVSEQAGGGLFADQNPATVSATSFLSNTAGFGGAVFHANSVLTVSNSTFGENEGITAAGGLYAQRSDDVHIYNSTFVNNQGVAGGTINANFATLTAYNTIFTGSTNDTCTNGSGTVVINASNLADDNTCDNATVSADMQLSSLGNYGGETKTYEPLIGSPAVDAGTEAVCAAAPVNNVDQRGVVRPFGSQCDVGAVELEITESVPMIVSSSVFTTAENAIDTFDVDTVDAIDSEGSGLTYSIGGDDSAEFNLNPTTGELQFTTPPDYETPTDVDTDNVYSLTITVTNSFGNTDVQTVTITVEDVAECVDFPVAVASSAELAFQIACFNLLVGGNHTLTITQNIILTGTLPTIDNATGASLVIAGNGNAIDGAGLYEIFAIADDTRVHIDHLTLHDATTSQARCGGGSLGFTACGAAIYSSGTLSVTNSTFFNNSAAGGGAILAEGNRTGALDPADSLFVENSTFYSNTATVNGAAVYVLRISATVRNSTFSDNYAASRGGAMYVRGLSPAGATLTMEHSTIVSNTTDFRSAGIGFFVSTAAITNSIVAHNYANGILQDCARFDTTISATGSLYTGGTCDNFALSNNLPVGSLQDNGGSTWTHALLPGNAAINAADDAWCAATDQRSVVRPQGSGCDAGAYEEELVPTITSGDTFLIIENEIETFDLSAVDDNDSEGAGLMWSMSGVDSAEFTFNSITGELQFATVPDYENPTDIDMNNVYSLTISVTNSLGYVDAQTVTVSVEDAFECADVPEFAADTAELAYAIACYNVAPAGSYTISITQDITLTSALPVIDNANGATLQLIGGDFTLDGDNNTYPHLWISRSNVMVNNLTLQNGNGSLVLMESNAVVTLTHTTFLSNTSSFDPLGMGACGGAVLNLAGSLAVQDTLFQYNIAELGGAICNTDGTVNLANVILSNNYATVAGGGFVNIEGVNNLRNVTISDNVVADGSFDSIGGGFVNLEGVASLIDVTISGNFVQGSGGGLVNLEGESRLTNVTISGNEALNKGSAGGGIYNINALTYLTHTTVTDNAAADGAGIKSEGFGATFLSASIVAGNQIGTAAHDLESDGPSYPSFGNNVVGTFGKGADVSGTNDLTGVIAPGLAPLADNGCVTPHIDGTCVKTHALQQESVALDHAIGSSLTTDQRGETRPFNTIADSGAYENQGEEIVCDVANGTDYPFASGTMTITVVTTGTLHCLSVTAVNETHPDATATIQTGSYWSIEGTDSNSETATGFNVTLELPHSYGSATGVVACRWTGNTWDCAAMVGNETTVTRMNVTEFSDWAVGSVDPTAVGLVSAEISRPSPTPFLIGLLIALLTGATRLSTKTLPAMRSGPRVHTRAHYPSTE